MSDAWWEYMKTPDRVQKFVDGLRRARATGRMSDEEYRRRMIGVFDRHFPGAKAERAEK